MTILYLKNNTDLISSLKFILKARLVQNQCRSLLTYVCKGLFLQFIQACQNCPIDFVSLYFKHLDTIQIAKQLINPFSLFELIQACQNCPIDIKVGMMILKRTSCNISCVATLSLLMIVCPFDLLIFTFMIVIILTFF